MPEEVADRPLREQIDEIARAISEGRPDDVVAPTRELARVLLEEDTTAHGPSGSGAREVEQRLDICGRVVASQILLPRFELDMVAALLAPWIKDSQKGGANKEALELLDDRHGPVLRGLIEAEIGNLSFRMRGDYEAARDLCADAVAHIGTTRKAMSNAGRTFIDHGFDQQFIELARIIAHAWHARLKWKLAPDADKPGTVRNSVHKEIARQLKRLRELGAKAREQGSAPEKIAGLDWATGILRDLSAELRYVEGRRSVARNASAQAVQLLGFRVRDRIRLAHAYYVYGKIEGSYADASEFDWPIWLFERSDVLYTHAQEHDPLLRTHPFHLSALNQVAACETRADEYDRAERLIKRAEGVIRPAEATPLLDYYYAMARCDLALTRIWIHERQRSGAVRRETSSEMETLPEHYDRMSTRMQCAVLLHKGRDFVARGEFAHALDDFNDALAMVQHDHQRVVLELAKLEAEFDSAIGDERARNRLRKQFVKLTSKRARSVRSNYIEFEEARIYAKIFPDVLDAMIPGGIRLDQPIDELKKEFDRRSEEVWNHVKAQATSMAVIKHGSQLDAASTLNVDKRTVGRTIKKSGGGVDARDNAGGAVDPGEPGGDGA